MKPSKSSNFTPQGYGASQVGKNSYLIPDLSRSILVQRTISHANQQFYLEYNSNDWILCKIQHWAGMGDKKNIA